MSGDFKVLVLSISKSNKSFQAQTIDFKGKLIGIQWHPIQSQMLLFAQIRDDKVLATDLDLCDQDIIDHQQKGSTTLFQVLASTKKTSKHEFTFVFSKNFKTLFLQDLNKNLNRYQKQSFRFTDKRQLLLPQFLKRSIQKTFQELKRIQVDSNNFASQRYRISVSKFLITDYSLLIFNNFVKQNLTIETQQQCQNLQNKAVKIIIICLNLTISDRLISQVSQTHLFLIHFISKYLHLFFMLTMEKIFKYSLENFRNNQTALQELNVDSFLQTNIKSTQNSSKFLKSQIKTNKNQKILNQKVLRRFSNQSYNFIENNQHSDILTDYKIKDFYSFQKTQSSKEPTENDEFQNELYDISEKYSSQLIGDQTFSSGTKTQKQKYFLNLQQALMERKQIENFQSAQSIKKQKQSQRALYLIKNHLELIDFKVNQIQLQLKQNCNFQSNISSNRLKKLNKLLRLLKIVQKFALQTQPSQQFSQNHQFKSFYSQQSKLKYSPNFNSTQQKQKRTKNLRSQFQQILKTHKLKQLFQKKQQQNVPQVLLSPNSQIKTFIRSQIKQNIQNTQDQEKERKTLKFFSLAKNIQQTKNSKSSNINQSQQNFVRKKLFSNNQNQLQQKQSQKTSIIRDQKNNYQKQNKQNQGLKIQKQSLMAIKCLNLSIHVLNLFRHSLSQKFTQKIISTEQNCQILSIQQKKSAKHQNNETNRKKVEIKQIRNLLMKLKQQTQKIYDTFKDQTRWNSIKKNRPCFSDKKQKKITIESKIESIYNETKVIFRKLQKLCLDTNRIELKNCY